MTDYTESDVKRIVRAVVDDLHQTSCPTVKALDRTVNGNGQEGIRDTVTRIEAEMKAMGADIAAIKDQTKRRAEVSLGWKLTLVAASLSSLTAIIIAVAPHIHIGG
ncbi:MAG TPA: hypothetical protein P5305_04905 [Rubrivivax sp.]|nr:hypothetical protein [Rubrivivax sp.]